MRVQPSLETPRRQRLANARPQETANLFASRCPRLPPVATTSGCDYLCVTTWLGKLPAKREPPLPRGEIDSSHQRRGHGAPSTGLRPPLIEPTRSSSDAEPA